jgi:hypothetical protein
MHAVITKVLDDVATRLSRAAASRPAVQEMADAED